MAHQMHDAGLNCGLREGGGDRLGEALQHQLGREAAVAVAGHRQRQFAILALQHPGRGAIPAVSLAGWRGLAVFAAQMHRQLGIRPIGLIFSSVISPTSPSRSSGRSTPFRRSSRTSFEMVSHASCR